VSSVVSEGIILVAVVVAASMISFTFMTGIYDIQSSTITSTKEIGDTIKTSVKIVHAVNISDTTFKIWVKNIGSTSIHETEIELCDLYFGEVGEFQIYHYDPTGTGWNYTILGDSISRWQPQDTLEIELTLGASASKGDYFVSFTTHNGVKDDGYFSIG
jgi:archaellum component FlaG (FlaF/FlaG flagellin family)